MGKSYFKTMFGLYFLALAVCGGCRVMLKLWYIDPATGFYTAGAAYAAVQNILLAAAAVVMVLINRLRRVDHDYPVRLEMNGCLRFFSLLLGAAALFYAAKSGMDMLSSQPGNWEMMMFREVGGTVNAVLAALAGLSFLYMGLRRSGGKTPNSLLLLLPSLWLTVSVVTRFNTYRNPAAISDNLFTILFMLFGAMFLLGYARTLLGIGRKDGRNYTIPFGLLASLCGLMTTVPNYIYMALYRTLEIPAPMLTHAESAFILILSIYAPLFVAQISRSVRYV